MSDFSEEWREELRKAGADMPDSAPRRTLVMLCPTHHLELVRRSVDPGEVRLGCPQSECGTAILIHIRTASGQEAS